MSTLDDFLEIEEIKKPRVRWYMSRTRIDFVWPERNVLGEDV